MDFLTDSYLRRLAEVESGLDPFNRNPNSSAKGLFQFLDDTGKAYGLDKHEFGTDAYTKAEIAAADSFTEDNRRALRNGLGREPTPGELYLAHQQGAGGAQALLANPNARAIDVVGEEAVKLNGGNENMTAQDFAGKWINKFDEGLNNMPDQQNLISVELPDGTIVEGVPANISKADLIQRLKSNGYDVTKFETPQEPKTANNVPNVPKEPSATETEKPDRFTSALRTYSQGSTFGFGDEAVAGLSSLIAYPILSAMGARNGKSLGDLYDEALTSERQGLEQAREAYPIQSLATEITGGVATGGGAARTATKIAPKGMSALRSYAAANPVKAGAGIAGGSGSVYGFGSGEGGFTDRAENAVKTGAISVPFGAGGGYVASKFGSSGASLADDAADNVSDAVQTGFGKNAVQKAKTSALAKLTPEQQARSSALEAAGIPRNKQTAAMIARDPKTWQFEQNTKGIAGVGDDIRNRYVQANEMIRGKLNEIGVKIGGKASTPYEAGESVTEAVIKKNREMQDEIGALYGKIREEAGDNVGLQPNRILDALDEASDNAYADNVVNSMFRKMKRYGVVDKDGNAIEDAALTVKNAEELRKFANKLRGDKQTDPIVTDIINALDDDVIDTAGTDAFKQARDAARSRFSEFETKILKNITTDKLASDDVLKRTVYGGKVKDLQALKQSLLSGTEDQMARGSQAWNDLKVQTIQSIIDDSSSAGGKLSGTSFKRQLDKIGKERLETVFDPEEVMQLRTIEKALEYTTVEVPESVVNYSGTGAANANNVLSGIIEGSPIGSLFEKAGDKLARTPGLGQIPLVASSMQGIGNSMQKSALKSSVKNVLDPESALKRLADPSLVGRAGTAAGIYGGNRE